MTQRKALRARRERCGLSLEQAAEIAGVTPVTWGLWERTARKPHPRRRKGISRALGCKDLDEVDALLKVDGLPDSEELRVPSGVPITMDYAASLRARAQEIVRMDNLFGGDVALPMGQRLLIAAMAKTRAEMPRDVAREVWAAIGEIAEVTGWCAFDAQDHDAVRSLNMRSLEYLRMAGDESMELLTIQNQAMHSAYVGDATTALQLSDSVLEGKSSLPPRVQTLFHVRRARALAQLGDAAGAAAAFGKATALYEDGVRDTDPPWAWWVTPEEIAGHHGLLFAAGGQWSNALETFASSLERLDAGYPRKRYGYSASVAFAAATVGDAATLDRALDVAHLFVDEVGSGRTAVNLANAARKVRRNRDDFPTSVQDKAEAIVKRLRCHYDLPSLLKKIPALANELR